MSTQTINRGPDGARPIGGAQGAWLVAEREITTKLRSKAYIVSSAVLLLLVLGGVLFSGFMANSGGFGGPTRVAAVGEATAAVQPLDGKGFEVTQAEDRAAAEQLVLDGEADAAVVPGGDTAVGLTVLAEDSPPSELIQALSAAPSVELLAPTADNPALAYLIAVAFGVIYMLSAITFGTTIAQSVVEEKQTRIVEILLATVSARTMLAGKILGNSILALAQVVAIVAVASVGLLATGQDLLLGELGTSLIWFGVLFAFGFVLLATMYAALATLVSRQEDVASAVSPVMWLVMLPYFAIIFFNSNPQALAIMSYIPFSAPIGMPMRLYLGTAEWWEPLLSLAILFISIAVVLLIGSRIYSNSILRTGAKVKLSEAIKG
ncbi:ABC transporter permease [Leucobacter sp. wl10]|uniref:ABC transporter permease n=1 Tax=Leucobacter sp. wl10 TaxID=2304677 RepID=UPI000E5A6B9D|nr:ABC transporter permease [Leucobacter sp. wl10]RGE20491.1 ABC transporter permease [Leucobacter sp. wl10]